MTTAKPPTGRWIVLALLALGGIGSYLTWQTYARMNHSTRQAVLFLEQTVEVMLEVDRPAAAPPVDDRREQQLAEARLELEILEDTVSSGRTAIEEALQMVKEQRDNFDFAHERYERLMPLVETGALDLLTASQIQSAYISARASLAQAKFYLGQAQRARGEPEMRRRQLERLKQQIALLEGVSEVAPPEPTKMERPVSVTSPAGIEAYFTGVDAGFFRPGMLARVTLANLPRERVEAAVVEARPLNGGVLVRLEVDPGGLPELPDGLRFFPCQVTVDASLPEEARGLSR